MKRFVILFALMLACSGMGRLSAGTLINSQAGLSVCIYNELGTGCAATGETVAVTPHPLWQPNFTDAVWISYQGSGYGDGDFQPYKGTTPVFAVEHKFYAGAGSLFQLQVWADDTAGVFLDGVELKAPVFTQSICSGQAIGCVPADAGNFSFNLTESKEYTLRFDVYQVGTGGDTTSNPMGLLYRGSVPDGGTTLILLGGALIGLETLRRRSRR
ncbi:MAG: VPDSG-CTERM sorting domain-containing protein [Bryobacteraceae bacterium]|nr:VPDSG-CTERM sorting domain-containing protein [Bryobacteraceae bacterium]